MPVIHYHYIHDLTVEQKRNLTAAITKAVYETTGIPMSRVSLWLHQTSPQDHSLGGVLLEDMQKDAAK